MRGRLAILSFWQIVRLQTFDPYAERAFERDKLAALIHAEKRGSEALGTGAAGTSDPVDEILRHVRQIVVDDLRNVVDVNPARGQIGGHEDAMAPLLETGERRGSLGLRAVAMDRRGGKAFAIQAQSEAFGSPLRAREYQAASFVLREQTAEDIELAIG